MNQYRMELKRNAKALLVWCICQGGLLIMGYIEYMFVFRNNADVSAIMAELPPTFAALFGISSIVDFSTARGFYCILVDFVFYVLAAYSSLLGISLVSGEETGKTAEFLYSKPVSRRHVLAVKMAAGVTCLAAMNLVTLVFSAATFGLASGEELIGAVVMAAVTSFLMQLVYFTAGAMLASLTTPGRASAWNLVFLLVTILSGKLLAIAGIAGPALIISSCDYFPMRSFMLGGSFGLWPWIAGVFWVVLFSAAALVGIERKNL